MENAPQLPSNYQLIGKLGIGSFATVWEAHDTENNINVAIKIIPHDLENADSNWRERLDNEVNVLNSIHHPHIAEFYKEIEEKDVSYLVFELCEKGTLGHLMLKLGQIPEDQMRGYFLQISEALRYLHEEAHIIHRDIKIDNILFDSDNTIKLIDFGLSVHFNPEEHERFTKICGSPKYVAPEMFFGEEYDSSIDIWALGVVLFYCISGYFPFESYQLQKLSYKIMFEEPIYPLGISDELLDLMKKLLDKEPDDRITWTQIFDHPWVKKAVPVTKESSKRSIMRPHPSNKLAPSVVPKIEPHETLNILEHEEYHDTITITHHSQATIKYPFTSSLSNISNITPATPPGQRRKRALNDSYDKITTVFQQKLVKFPAKFTPLHPLPLEWKGIECQFIQAKTKHTYDIHTCGPFLYLIPTGKKAHQFMIFTPNHSCSKPKEEKKNKYVLPIHSPFKIIPTLAFVSSKEKVLLEIMDYIKKINDDTNNFLITMRINENIANNEFQQFSEELSKPINVVSSIQYIRQQFRFQTLEKETGKQNLDFELKQSNIVVFPCIDLPHKFGNNDFAIMSFCLFTSQQKAYFFKTPNQNEMIKWILYLHIYSNRIESNPNELLSKLVTPPASPQPQPSKPSSVKSIQKPTTSPNPGMKPRPLKKVATTFAALPITPTETPKKTLKKRPQQPIQQTPPSQTIQQTSQSQPITVKPLSDIFATSKNDDDDDDNDFSMQVENLSIEIKPPEDEQKEQKTENENEKDAQTENQQLSIPISPRSSFGRRLSLHESSFAHFINKDKQNQESENIGFNIPSDYQQRAEKSLREYEEEHKQLTVKKDVFTPPDFDELISKSIVSMSTFISEDTRAMQIQTLINSIHDDNTNEIVDFSFVDQSDEEIVQTTLNEMKDEDTIHLSQFFNFKEFPEYDQEALINSSRPFNPLYSEFTAIDQGLRQSGSSGLTLTNPYASKLCFLVACVLVNGLKEFSDQSSTVSLVGPFTDLMSILPDLESVVTEIRTEELTLAQASIASTILIKKNTLGIFLREAKRNDEWISKYYLNSSLMANYEFLETFVLMLEPMLNTMTFNIAVTPNIFKGMPEDEINRFALTPMFAYLEINDLFKPGANAAKIIAKQFDVGLKKRGRFLSISSWDVLDKISQGQKKSTLSKDFSNSVGASPNLFGAANFFGRASSNLESWVSLAIQNEKIHVWFLLVHVNLILMGNPYYYEEASLNDPYRVNYITKKIYKFFSNLR